MDGHGTDSVGMRLRLDGKKTLVLGEENIVLHDPASRKANRSTCGSIISSDPASKRSISLYNILWVELTDRTLVVDFASPASKTVLKHESWSLALAPPGVDNNTQDDVSPETFVSTLLSRAYGESQPRKRAYVLINPNSGPGGALRHWANEVKPLFEAARMELDIVTLSRGGEATDLAEQVDIDRYDTIVACSGDGTPHEIFNGLAKRADAHNALTRIAVSAVPCGSGNAMSCNLNGSYRPSVAALAIIKGIRTPVDLVSVTQGDRRIVSFLSQSLGIIAESDLGTEHLRWMGGARFDVGVLMGLFRQKCYPCDLAVKVEVEKPAVKAHYRQYASGKAVSEGAAELKGESGAQQGLPPLKYGTIQDELPAGWELMSYDKIGNFYCGNMAYMAADTNFFAAAIASDGCMDLVTVDGDLSPVTAAKIFLSVESGKFFDNPHVSYRKISAYRIIPRKQEDGYISIDGERVPFEPFQAEIHHGLGRVLSKSGGFEAAGPLNWEKATVA